MSFAVGRMGARIVALVGFLAGALATAMPAQKSTTSRWNMQDTRGGFCIWYLVDPAVAPLLADRGAVFTPAGTGKDLPASLEQTIHDEPRFNSWIPAAICVGLYGSVSIDDQKPILATAEAPIAIVTHFIAAQSARGSSGTGYLLISLSSNNRVVRNYAGDRSLPVESVTLYSGKDRGTTEDRVDFKLAGTQVTWIGHPSGEPSVEKTHPVSFGYAGAKSVNFQGTLEFAPSEGFGMLGALRIVGKGPLAKALKSSPIRPSGPLARGGADRLIFQPLTGKGGGGN